MQLLGGILAGELVQIGFAPSHCSADAHDPPESAPHESLQSPLVLKAMDFLHGNEEYKPHVTNNRGTLGSA